MTKGFDTFDKDEMARLRTLVEETLSDLTDKTGVVFKLGKGKFTSKNGSFADITFALVSNEGEVETKEVTSFKQNARQYNVDPDDLGEGFEYKGAEYLLAGLDPKARSKTGTPVPFVCIRVTDGHRVRFPRHIVVDAMMNLKLQRRGEAPLREMPTVETSGVERVMNGMEFLRDLAQQSSDGTSDVTFDHDALQLLGYDEAEIAEMLGEVEYGDPTGEGLAMTHQYMEALANQEPEEEV